MFRSFIYLLFTTTFFFPVCAIEREKVVSGNSSASLSGASFLRSDDEIAMDFLPLLAQNPCYQSLFDLAYGYLDYCISSFERYEQGSFKDIRIQTIYEQNLHTAHNLVFSISMIDTGHTTVPEALENMLLTRLENLDRRADMYRKTQEYYRQHKKLPTDGYFIPTIPKGVALLQSQVDKGIETAKIDLQGAKEAIDRYHFINLLIYHLYKLVPDPTLLPLKVKRLISCSVTLHSLLLDQTTDLSYPDFAVITYNEDPLEFQNAKDYNYWWSNYKREPCNVVLKNWCRETVVLLLTPADTQQGFVNGSKILELPRPKWLYPDRSVSVPQLSPAASSSSSMDEWLQSVPGISSASLGSSSPKESQNTVKGRRKVNTRRRLPSEIVQKRGHQTEVSSLTAAAAAATVGNDAATVSTSVSTAPSSKEDPLKIVQHPISQYEGFTSATAAAAAAAAAAVAITPDTHSLIPTSQVTLLQNAIMDDQLADPQNMSDLSDVNDDALGDSLKSSALTTELPEVVYQPPVMPRGIRVFHPKMALRYANKLCEEEAVSQLGGKWQDLVDTIFDYRRRGQGFNFGDFRSLWERINGKGSVRSSGHGSSHYALLDRDGKVVLGTFAHGDGFEYTSKTVRYLRAALQLINISPTRPAPSKAQM